MTGTLEISPIVVLTCPDNPARMGATCPSCGSTNSHVVQVKDGDRVVKTYFECGNCGNVW